MVGQLWGSNWDLTLDWPSPKLEYPKAVVVVYYEKMSSFVCEQKDRDIMKQ